jgi:hypothetical protein
MLKFAMAAVIALAAGNGWAQVTGKTVLNNPAATGANLWQPLTGSATYPGSPQVSATTGTFHAGGVAACDGCHVMHNANNGVARSTTVAPWTNAVPAFLLQGSDQSSTCLMCHGDNNTLLAGKPYVMTNTTNNASTFNYSPGGDFGWVRASFPSSPGQRHGHNIVAADFGFAGEAMTAPGGTYTAATAGPGQFACSNCHDPHGRYRMESPGGAAFVWAGPANVAAAGVLAAISQPIWSSGSYGELPKADAAIGSYRLLAGYGYVPASSLTSPFPFVNNPPLAVAPAEYNRSEAGSGGLTGNKSLEVRVAYGSGMSEWCQNCHTNIHLDNYVSGAMGASGLRHPAGHAAILKTGQFNTYNNYVSSGRFTPPAGKDMYTSLVPFENAGKMANYTNAGGTVSDITKLKNAANGSDSAGIFIASQQSNVMCLSCHRAHASSFNSMVRWNNDDTFITNGSTTAFVDTQGRGNGVLQAGYYGRLPSDFGVFQRSLCNKCHGKD